MAGFIWQPHLSGAKGKRDFRFLTLRIALNIGHARCAFRRDLIKCMHSFVWSHNHSEIYVSLFLALGNVGLHRTCVPLMACMPWSAYIVVVLSTIVLLEKASELVIHN